jgi:hypothetical protein
MSEMLPNPELNFLAADLQWVGAPQLKMALEVLALKVARADPNRPKDLDPDAVEEVHVQRATDMLIQAAKDVGDSLSGDPVFLCYDKEDLLWAKELRKDLHKPPRVPCFLAPVSINPGKRWETKIRQALRQCRVLLVLATPAGVANKWCNWEVGAAWGLHKHIIPALRQIAEPQLPEVLRLFQWHWARTREEQDKLIRFVKGICLGEMP